MSVSWECKAGENDNIYFIDNCCIEIVTDDNGAVNDENTVEFKVGNKVYFIDWFYKMVEDNQYIMIKFKDEKGRIYSAIETFFVTADVWKGLKMYFKDVYADNN